MAYVPISTTPVESPSLDKMVQAANDVAQTARTLLTAMLAVAVTLAATMIAATDEALFRDAAKVFPSLGVEIRLSTAFTLAPPLFCFIHVNALLQLHLLAKRLRALDAAITQRNADRKGWLGQVHGIAIAQLLTGESEGRMHRQLLSLVTWLAVMAVPVALLLTAQVSFLRYQNTTITIVHQLTLLFDLCVLLWFAESVRRPDRRRWIVWGARAVAGAAFLTVEFVSVFHAIPLGAEQPPRWNVFDEALCKIEGFAWTCRHLDLSNRVLINNDAKPELLAVFGGNQDIQAEARRKMVVLALPGRSFRRGRFDGAQLFATDLQFADFEEASLVHTNLHGANLFGANLRGAILTQAELKDANLAFARMAGSKLDGAFLQGADLNGTDLFSANLLGANLEIARLGTTRLDGADLNFANLNRIHISHASLLGTTLEHATLVGAWLWHVDLRAANLSQAEMQGAELSHVNFKGALLADAHLDGAHIKNANLRAAYMKGASVRMVTGADLVCDAMVPPAPGGSRWQDLDKTLADAGIDSDHREAIRRRIGATLPANCTDETFLATKARKLTNENEWGFLEAYKTALQDIACTEPEFGLPFLRTVTMSQMDGQTVDKMLGVLTSLPHEGCPNADMLRQRGQVEQELRSLKMPQSF
jgi:uncharacterized protein YjbI with pentapeptide repeats